MSTWVTVRPAVQPHNFRQTRPLWTASTLNDQYLNEAFNRFFGAPRQAAPTGEVTYRLPVNVAQDEHNYYIFAQLPGVQADQLEINAVENKLTWLRSFRPRPRRRSPPKARKSPPSSGCARNLAPRMSASPASLSFRPRSTPRKSRLPTTMGCCR